MGEPYDEPRHEENESPNLRAVVTAIAQAIVVVVLFIIFRKRPKG